MDLASQQGHNTATAGVITRPPFLYLACLILGLVLDHVLPLPLTLPETALVRWTAGGGLILLGVAILAAGICNFSHAGTPVPSNQPVCIWSGASATPTATTRRVSGAGCSR
jgi:hypothetical protein